MKKIFLSLFLLFAASSFIPAQTVVTAEDDEEIVDGEDNDDESLYDEESNDVIENAILSAARGEAIPASGDEVLPQGMNANIDALLKQWQAEQYLTFSDDADFSAIIPADSTVYIQRLRAIPAGLELPYNEVVRKYIERYANSHHRSVSYMLGAQNFYVPIFEEALERYGLPLELKYLPVIESALNPKAVSPVGAGGLWQFMPSTGKRYGLEINSLLDERCDPVKSSEAAAHFLADLFKIYQDWSLVIASYNCGPGNVNKAIHRAGGARDYWEIYPYLPKETRGYVPAFIAANYIMNYYCEHGIHPAKTSLPLATDTIIVSRDINLAQIAQCVDVPLEQLRALNPQYRRDIVPGHWRPCAIRMPQEAALAFIDLGDSIYNYKASELLSRRSTVTINTGNKPDVTPIVDSNHNTDEASSHHSYHDKKTYDKRNDKNKYKSKNDKSKAKKTTSSSHTVKSGDTLEVIARRNGTTVAKLQKMNGIKGTLIKPGQKLRVK